MHSLVEIGLGNALVASLLTLPAAAVSRLGRWPALAHSLWLLVFVKLLTPVAFPIAVSWPALTAPAEEREIAAIRDLPPAFMQSAPPVADFQILSDGPPAAQATGDVTSPAAPAPAGVATPPPHGRLSWQDTFGLCWLAGSLLWCGWTAWHICRFQRSLRYARGAPRELQRRVDELAEQLGVRRPPQLWLVPGALSPLVWGLG